MAGEGGRAGGAGEHARRVREHAGGDVGEGHRQDALGGRAVALIDAAGNRAVFVDVLELEELTARRVDAGAEGTDGPGAAQGDFPNTDEVATAAGHEAEGLGGIAIQRRQQVVRAPIEDLVLGEEAAHVIFDDSECLGAGEPHTRRLGASRRQVFAADRNQVAVVDRKHDPRAFDDLAAQEHVEVDEPDMRRGIARTAGVDRQIETVEPHHPRDPRQEVARVHLERRETGGSRLAGPLEVAGDQAVAASWNPRDAAAFEVADAAAAQIDVGHPARARLGEERLQGAVRGFRHVTGGLGVEGLLTRRSESRGVDRTQVQIRGLALGHLLRARRSRKRETGDC